MSIVSEGSLHGELHIYPFATHDREVIVSDRYEALLGEFAADEILVLTQMLDKEDLRRRLASNISGIVDPTVRGLSEAAQNVLERGTPEIERLSENTRIEILAHFLDSYDWDEPYLRRSSEYESFQQDIGQLLLKADSQGGLTPEHCESSALQEVAEVGEQFQVYLADHDYVDPSTVTTRATSVLDEIADTTESYTTEDWEVILVTEYEEVDPPKRAFLGALAAATDAEIVGVAERASRILSSWNEPGMISDLGHGLSVEQHGSESATPSSQLTAVAQFFSLGTTPSITPAEGSVEVIEADTFTDQIGHVADEIERLCQTANYTYDDFLIVYRDTDAPIGNTIRRLRRAGIPSRTTAANDIDDDPAVRELHRVTEFCARPDEAAEGFESVSDAFPAVDDPASSIDTIRDAPTPAAGLWTWVRDTNLKGRIASQYDEVEARNQFSNVQEAVDLAAFLDAAPELEATWDRYLVALERAFQYASTRYQSVSTADDQGGVTIGTTYGVKTKRRKAVFMLNVTDEEYPFAPNLTALLPQTRLQNEPDYPTLTNQTTADVRNTFPTEANEEDDPFYDYFAQLSRRLLGVGANVATERLYFGMPREGSGSLGEYNQPSRFLEALVETFDFVEPYDTDGDGALTSHGQVSEFAVERLDETLEAIRRAAVGDDTVNLDAYKQELAALQTVLDEPDAETLEQAVEARIDIRHGRVRRE